MNKLDLSGRWKLRGEFLDTGAERFCEVAERQDGEFRVFNKNKTQWMPSRDGFMQADVPCDVITALINNGTIQEPLIKTNTDNCMWINDMSWWFMRDFNISQELYDSEEVRLFIETLDYNADIIINGRIFKHKNAFRAFCKDVKRYLKVGRNYIIIRLTVGYEAQYLTDSLSYYSNSTYGQRVYLRKPQFTHGWDWCKPVPTCGIGGQIYIEGISGACVSFFRCDTLEIKKDAAKLNFYFEIENLSMCTADDAVLHAELLYDGKTVHEFEREFYAAGGINYISEQFELLSPALWYPNGYGGQPLYTVRACVTCRGIKNNMQDKKIGIRTISIDQRKMPDSSRRFDFIVNGVKIFCKGGNWVPADSVYLRVTEQKYKTLVQEAAECNFNMLRIWGGGLYEPDCFYDYCSEYGILIMQDFMYACAFYPDYLDWFMHEAQLEAEYQTKRLAHQACLAVWAGNNEVHESYTDWFRGDIAPEYLHGAKIFNYILPAAVKTNTPLVPYMPSSPFYGNKANDMLAGDSHVWGWILDKNKETGMQFMYELEAFDRLAAKVRMSSEYGFYGALKYSSVEKYHGGEPIEINSGIWAHHGERLTFDNRGKRRLILDSINRHLVDSSRLEVQDYLLYSGIMQGILYDELTLALRRREHCSGKLIWMYNDCWPETGWTVIDYYATRKISYYYLKRAFETCKFIIRAIDGQVSMVALNETPVSQNVLVEYGYMTFSGDKHDARTEEINIEAHGRFDFKSFAAAHDTKKGFYYMLAKNNAVYKPAVSLRGYYRDIVFPEANIKIIKSEIKDGRTTLILSSDVFVPVINIKVSDDTIKMSDNYFSLLPGLEKTAEIYAAETPVVEAVIFEPESR